MFSRRLILVALFCGLFFVPAGNAGAGFLPGLDRVGLDEGEIYANGCMAGDTQVRSRPCRFGDLSSSKRVVLLGDSHAAHWGGALFRVARQNGWKVIVLTRASCPAALVSTDKYCDLWRNNALRRIKKIRPGLVLVGSAANDQAYSVLRYGHKLSRHASERRLVAGMVRTLRFLKRWSGQTVLIRDQAVAPFDVTACLRKNFARSKRCGFRSTRTRTWSYDFKAARQVDGIRVIDPQEFLCPGGWCRPLAGRYLIYRNDSHLAATFTRRQHGWLGRKLGDPWHEAPQRETQKSERQRKPAVDFPNPVVQTLWSGATNDEPTPDENQPAESPGS